MRGYKDIFPARTHVVRHREANPVNGLGWRNEENLLDQKERATVLGDR